ncbi:sigma-54 interaction domain-containing protein [Geomonas subterranea]|uniref:sigma-54 interaction domain-containing protein n=1 Tax=Geomonas subterranea TaxID=2847989 RepID=UPI001CD597FF|nr:sigma-54 dependent transcriptional regulator [Geomonas fuzhouensis]
MKHIYFAWVGETDFKASETQGVNGPGPIASVLTHRAWSFEKAVLLCNYSDDSRIETFMSWLVSAGIERQSIDLRKVSLLSPIDYREIYEVASQAVESVLEEAGKGYRPAFHLNPGTGAMQAIWVLLGKGRFLDALLIESSLQRGVGEADIPFDIQAELIPAIKRRNDKKLVQLFQSLPDEAPEFEEILHSSDVMRETIARARHVASRDLTVLIEGESGTGKEMFAKAIHKASPRSEGAFIAVNCGAIPSELIESALFGHKKGSFTGADRDHHGFFENADKGTLFLDEIGELPKSAQVKLLRVLQEGRIQRVGGIEEKPVDVRVIAATNRDLANEVYEDRFRFDLYHRIAVAIIKLPPLRNRKEDLRLLIDHMLAKANDILSGEMGYKRKKLSVKGMKALLDHPWPGNVRELQNTLTRICLWTPRDVIDPDDVQSNLLTTGQKTSPLGGLENRHLGEGFRLSQTLRDIERNFIEKALDETHGHIGRAHKMLGLNSPEALSYRIKALGVNNPYKAG